jgi:hypothetical protein
MCPMLTNQRSKLLGGGTRKWYLAGGAPLPLAVYQPKGAASLAASYVNLANPGTNNAAPGVAPTFAAATGWTFNGATQWLTTGINTAANMSIIMRISNVSAANGAVMGGRGAAGGGTGLGFFAILTGNHAYDNGTRGAIAGAVASGVFAVAGTKGYRDGADDGVTLANSIAEPVAMYMGGYNSNGTANNFLTGNILAVAIYSSVLTAPQVAAVSAAMAAL